MILTINGRDFNLAFGMDFLDYLNKANSISMEVEGQQMSTGIGGAGLVGNTLESRLPSTLRLLIKAGTSHLKFKPSNEDISEYINSLIVVEEDENGEMTYNKDEYNLVFDEIKSELKKQPATLIEMGLIQA